MKNVSVKLFVCALACYLVPNLNFAQGGNSAKNLTNKMNITSFNKYLPDAKVDSGVFILTKKGETYCLEMANTEQKNKQHYRIINCFDAIEFNEVDSNYFLNRKSGDMKFESKTENTGDFVFSKNPGFVKFLEDEGVPLDNDLYYFKLFLGDIDTKYILDIKALGYQPTITELGRLVWHDASVAFIKDISALLPQISLNEISMMSAHDISVDYIQSFLDVGITEIDAFAAKKAKSKGVTPQSGDTNLLCYSVVRF